MLDPLRRSLRYRRKLRAAGYRIVTTGTLHPSVIRYPITNAWMAEWYEGTDCNVYASPHYHALLYHIAGRDMADTPYVDYQRSLRGVDHPRPEEWIRAMQDRLCRLYVSIRDEGYRLACVADRIAVDMSGDLWDGGHRH